MGDFSQGVFECFSDLPLCLASFLCASCQYGTNMETLNEPEWILGNSCPLNCVVCCITHSFWIFRFPVGGAFTMFSRQRIRKHYNLAAPTESLFFDCLLGACCVCCTVHQEAKQIGAPIFLFGGMADGGGGKKADDGGSS